MQAEDYISHLQHRIVSSTFKGHFKDAWLALRLKHTFAEFAKELAKQKAILDGHDRILEPHAWKDYVLDITKEDFDEYMSILLEVGNTNRVPKT